MQSDPVTVLVFQNNSSARTFRIPLDWFNRFGILLGILVGLATVSTLTAGWYFWKARRLGPAKVQDLEQEVDELRAKLLAAQTHTRPVAEPAPTDTVATSPAEPEPPSSLAPLPAAAPEAVIPFASTPGSKVFFGSAPLLRSGKPLPNPTTLPIRLSPIQTQWQGKNLLVKFNIQYTADDGGHQTGRIIVLARGPQAILGYPHGVMDAPTADSIISFARGEYFSVGRFREVLADMGTVETKESITEVVALILGQNGETLMTERLGLPASGGASAPAAPGTGKSAAKSSSSVPSAPDVPAGPAAPAIETGER